MATRVIEARRDEPRRVLEFVRSVDDQPDRVLLITGEAGIGKTHLARGATARLAAEGYTVAWGRADAVERAVPYAAISQVLAALPGGSSVQRWVASDLPSSDAVRQHVHVPVAELLESQCVAGPLVIVVDDLHHADEDTLVLLGFLVRRLVDLPVMWIFTARARLADPVPGLATLVHRLEQDGRLDELPLERLPPEDVARLAEAAVGRPLRPPVLDVVVDRAEGNPFFAIQVALSLAESGVLERDEPLESGATVPSPSRGVALLERVFPLGQSARAVARLAAVFGDLEVDQLDALAALVDVDVIELEAGFDRLVRAELLRPVGGVRYAFVHDLVRETLYADLGPAERRRLHGAAAQSLLDRRARGEPVDLVELARHLSLGSHGPDARAADALRQAGDTLVASSPHSASLRYRQAISYLPSGEDDTALHVALARALRRAGDSPEVVRVCRDGLRGASGAERDRLIRYLAAALVDVGQLGDALQVTQAGLAERPDSVVLLATMALLHRQLEEYDAAGLAIARAAALARTPDERLAVVFQRLNLGVDAGTAGQDALAELEALIPLLDPDRRLMAHAHAAGACGGFGEVYRGLRHLHAADELVSRGIPDVDWPWSLAGRVVLEVSRGRWDHTLAVYERGADEFVGGTRLLVRNHVLVPMSDIAFARHDLARLGRYASDVETITSQARRMRALVESKVDRLEGRHDDAIDRLEAARVGVPDTSYVGLFLLLMIGQAQLDAGSQAGARRLLDDIRRAADTLGTVWARVLCGLVELIVADDVTAGGGGLELALEHGVLRYEPDFRLHLGRLGVDAESNLVNAHRQFAELGAIDGMTSTEAELRRRGLRVPSRRRVDRFALTDAEQRVVELVASGLSNRAIAERLAYSIKTIEAYLSRVYAKTGCTNRVELARRFPAHARSAGSTIGP